MEPWKCSLGWKIGGGQHNKRLVVSIDAEDTINFNCTTRYYTDLYIFIPPCVLKWSHIVA